MAYPTNLREFDKIFKDDEACLHFLESVRWGSGFKCQSCGGTDYWVLSTGLRRCRSCRAFHFLATKQPRHQQTNRFPHHA
ncbi:MAG: transposase [Bdellovibrionaceae bacterium]|nr:transposase [Pseudobdellovibrionaceae bacterium]